MRNGEFIKKGVKQPQEIVPENRLILWAAYPGEGKSLLGQALLYHIAYGAPFLGNESTVGNVMFIDSENRKDILTDRIVKIKNRLEMDGYKKQGEIDFQHYSGFMLDDKSTWTGIETEVKFLQPSAIMIDHLAMFHHQDEDKAPPMTKVAVAIEELMDIGNSSVLVQHHFNKQEGTFFKRLRGSSAILAKSDIACEVRALSRNGGKLEKVGLIFQPRKDITPKPIRIKIEEEDDWIKFIHDGTYQPVEDIKMDMLAHRFYHLFLEEAEELTVNAVKSFAAGMGSDTEVRNCLRLLDYKGLINSDRRELGGKLHYSLSHNSGFGKQCPWCNERFAV